jgi:hypothetical protein
MKKQRRKWNDEERGFFVGRSGDYNVGGAANHPAVSYPLRH